MLVSLLLASISSLLVQPTPPAADPLSLTTYAIYKPRNVLSAVGETNDHFQCKHPNLTKLMVDAGVKPLNGHVGRLDAQTSGLILVTADSWLLRGVLNWPQVIEQYGEAEQPMTKRYELLLAGRHEADSEKLSALGEPLTHQRNNRRYHSDAAVSVEHLGSFRDDALATGDYELIDRIDHEQVERDRAKLERERRRPRISRATGEVVPAFVPEGGWLTRVSVVLAQGRHHQIRRLCKRAGLRLLHLKRVAVGPCELLPSDTPGTVRPLCREEKQALYERCLPGLLRERYGVAHALGQDPH